MQPWGRRKLAYPIGPHTEGNYVLTQIKLDPLRVSEIENASGGYRPGPLRNALVLARMIDLGYVQDDLAGTQVDHRSDGSYAGSKIDPRP